MTFGLIWTGVAHDRRGEELDGSPRGSFSEGNLDHVLKALSPQSVLSPIGRLSDKPQRYPSPPWKAPPAYLLI